MRWDATEIVWPTWMTYMGGHWSSFASGCFFCFILEVKYDRYIKRSRARAHTRIIDLSWAFVSLFSREAARVNVHCLGKKKKKKNRAKRKWPIIFPHYPAGIGLGWGVTLVRRISTVCFFNLLFISKLRLFRLSILKFLGDAVVAICLGFNTPSYMLMTSKIFSSCMLMWKWPPIHVQTSKCVIKCDL